MRTITVKYSEVIVLENRKCELCSEEFEPKRTNQRFCSPDCRVIFNNKEYHDRVRHGGKRHELINQNGLVCSECGNGGDLFGIVAHHKTLDKTDHKDQELLCRACHARLHMLERQGAYFELVCKQCGEQFIYNDERTDFCSIKCKKKAEYIRDSEKIKLRVKEWKEENPDRVRKNSLKYFYANHEKCLIRQRQYRLRKRIEREKQLTLLAQKAGDNKSLVGEKENQDAH